MGRLKQWALGLWRRVERVPWHPWVSVPVLAAVGALVLLAGSYCDPFCGGAPESLPKVETVPLSTVQRIAENMADTNLGLLDRIRGLESRQPERIYVSAEPADRPPAVCSEVTEINLSRGEASSVVYEQVTGGWSVSRSEGLSVEGCDIVRQVGNRWICDTPRLGKWSIVAGGQASAPHSVFANTEYPVTGDAWVGLGWQRHRDSKLSVAALYGVDQTIRLRVEYRVNLW